MKQIPTKSQVLHDAKLGKGCLGKCAPDEPVFILRGRDQTAPAAIRDWAIRAARRGSNAEKVGTAILESVQMEAWQRRHGAKIPD